MPVAECGFEDTPNLSGRDALVLQGPTLLVEIGFDPNWQIGTSMPPNLPSNSLRALVDTGATESSIDSALAARLQLPIIDRQQVAGISGVQNVDVHLAQIYIPSLNVTVGGRFAGVHLTAGGQTHSALIGRVFLQYCTMVYEGLTGAVTIRSYAK